MQYSTAENLIELFLRHLREQDDILKDVRRNETQEDFLKVRKIVGATMGAICLDALNPIFDEYPELKPPAMR